MRGICSGLVSTFPPNALENSSRNRQPRAHQMMHSGVAEECISFIACSAVQPCAPIRDAAIIITVQSLHRRLVHEDLRTVARVERPAGTEHAFLAHHSPRSVDDWLSTKADRFYTHGASPDCARLGRSG